MEFENFDQFYNYLNNCKICGEKLNYPSIKEFYSGSLKKINFGSDSFILFKNNEIIKFECIEEVNLAVRHCNLDSLIGIIKCENSLKFFLIAEMIAYGKAPDLYRFIYQNNIHYITKITVSNNNITRVELKVPGMINFPHHDLNEVDKKINLLKTFQ